MKKTITIAAILLASSLFATGVSASGFGQDIEGDMLYGNGAVVATSGESYTGPARIQHELETDMLSNLEELENASEFQPYQLVSGETDNRDDLRDEVS
jgi:predicted small secreted protein